MSGNEWNEAQCVLHVYRKLSCDFMVTVPVNRCCYIHLHTLLLPFYSGAAAAKEEGLWSLQLMAEDARCRVLESCFLDSDHGVIAVAEWLSVFLFDNTIGSEALFLVAYCSTSHTTVFVCGILCWSCLNSRLPCHDVCWEILLLHLKGYWFIMTIFYIHVVIAKECNANSASFAIFL